MLLRFYGDLDLRAAPTLAAAFREAMSDGDCINIDLKDVSAIDKLGAGYLVILRQRLEQDDKRLRLINVPPSTRDIIRRYKLSDIASPTM